MLFDLIEACHQEKSVLIKAASVFQAGYHNQVAATGGHPAGEHLFSMLEGMEQQIKGAPVAHHCRRQTPRHTWWEWQHQ